MHGLVPFFPQPGVGAEVLSPKSSPPTLHSHAVRRSSPPAFLCTITLQAKSWLITSSLGVAGTPALPFSTTTPARGCPSSTRRPLPGDCTRLGCRQQQQQQQQPGGRRGGDRTELKGGDCVASALCGAPRFYDAPSLFEDIIYTECANDTASLLSRFVVRCSSKIDGFFFKKIRESQIDGTSPH